MILTDGRVDGTTRLHGSAQTKCIYSWRAQKRVVKLFLLQSPPDVEANNVEPGVGGNVGEMNQDGHNSASDSRSGCANQLESAKNQVSSSSGDNVAHDNHTYCVIDGQDNFYFL